MNTYAYVGGNPLKYIDPYDLKVWMGEKSIVADPTGLGGHTWIIIEPDHPEEFSNDGFNLPLDKNGRFVLRAGPDADFARTGKGNMQASVGGDSTTEWRQRFLIPPPKYNDGDSCSIYSDDTRFIRDILEAFKKYRQGSLPYDGSAGETGFPYDYTRGVQPNPNIQYYNSNSFTSGLLKDAGATNIPDPWGIQPGLDKPIPLY